MMCPIRVNMSSGEQDRLGQSLQSDDTRKVNNSSNGRLGYGGDGVPSSVDLGYGDEAPVAVPIDAAPIRPNKRISQRNNFSIYDDVDLGNAFEAEALAWSDSDSEYSESESDLDDDEDEDEQNEEDDEDYLSGEDPADFVHDSLDHKDSFHSRKSDSKRRAPSRVSVDYGEEANPTMPTRVELQFDKGAPDTPRRISLQFNQSAASIGSMGSSTTSRRGRPDVSIGTSSLPRRADSTGTRRVTLSHTTNPFSQRSARRTTMDTGAATPRQLQAMRRTTIDHQTDTRAVTRRITCNTSSRPVRRTTMDHHPVVPPPARRAMMPRNPSIRPARRTTMDHCRDRTPDTGAPAPPRPSLTRSTMVMAGAPDSKTGRRLTMDYLKSTSATKCAGGTLRRVTMDTSKAPPRRNRSPVRMLPRRTYSGRAA